MQAEDVTHHGNIRTKSGDQFSVGTGQQNSEATENIRSVECRAYGRKMGEEMATAEDKISLNCRTSFFTFTELINDGNGNILKSFCT